MWDASCCKTNALAFSLTSRWTLIVLSLILLTGILPSAHASTTENGAPAKLLCQAMQEPLGIDVAPPAPFVATTRLQARREANRIRDSSGVVFRRVGQIQS